MERKASVNWRLTLGRDDKIKEVVMAKVIESYVRKNFRRLLNRAPQLQRGKGIEFCSQTKKHASWNGVPN
jgi:hypothetical protein